MFHSLAGDVSTLTTKQDIHEKLKRKELELTIQVNRVQESHNPEIYCFDCI